MHELIWGFVGIGLGSSIALALAEFRVRAMRTRIRAEVVADRAAAHERIQLQDEQLQSLRNELQARDQRFVALQDTVRHEAMQRAVAEGQLQQVTTLQEQLQTAQQNYVHARSQLGEAQANLQREQALTTEKQLLLDQAQHKLTDTFKALSVDALQQNSQSFMQLAEAILAKFQTQAQGDLSQRHQAIAAIVSPLQDTLQQVGTHLNAIETARTVAYTSLTEQVKSLAAAQTQLQRETTNLGKALRSPNVRGRWGEIQLQRVVEMAGMLEYCDFAQQVSVTTEQGQLRPDMVIQLPNQRRIVVDAKTPLQAYLAAMEATDEKTKGDRLRDYTRHLRTHLTQLGSKRYWEQFQPAPEFAILFLPGEIFFSAALEQDPELIEFGVDQRVILATPTTLIALLKAIAYGWREERLAQNAQQISTLGKELYDRVYILTRHMAKLRQGLDGTVDAFNKVVGSLESRVLITARKFKALGITSSDAIEDVNGVDRRPRSFSPTRLSEQDADALPSPAMPPSMPAVEPEP